MREEHATLRSPRPEGWGISLYFEVHKDARMHATCRGTGTPLSRKEPEFVGLTDRLVWMQCGRLTRVRDIPEWRAGIWGGDRSLRSSFMGIPWAE